MDDEQAQFGFVAGDTPRRTAACERSFKEPHREPHELSDAELLQLIVGARSECVAETLSSYGNLRGLSTAHPAVLRDQGLSERTIARLGAVFEIARRFGEVPFKEGEPFRGPADVYAQFREHLAAETTEHFYAVLLDNKLRKLRDILVSKGSLTTSIVHPRDVFAQVIRFSAAAVVFLHNHPSGDPAPSKEDIEITRRLREVGDLVGVRVLDHIVVGRGRYVSFVDDGYW
ncbi:MAG: DNA repair protein RadC [Deltaproteobacteria bacterium]|nr:DNA repair protein RadC [Deltaproteobacteria bacterium]